MEPIKYYRILFFDKEGHVKLFSTERFREPNNWFESEAEGERFIKANFLDCQEVGSHAADTIIDAVLWVAPVFAVQHKPVILLSP